MADFWEVTAESSVPTLGSCMVLILFYDSLIAPLSICSVLFALILRFAQTFHKVIVRITATFIIAAILFSCDAEYNEVPCIVTILNFFMIFSCVVNINAVVGESTALFFFPPIFCIFVSNLPMVNTEHLC
jgi:hypothetical protein